MDVILVPGLWLDASSWEHVLPALTDAGHTPHALTLPGTGEPATSSGGIGIADWVGAVVAEIDRIDGPVVLVGHSGGGNVVWGAADARPARIARVVLVDTMPPPPGAMISEFEIVDGTIPFPGWQLFDDEEVFDLDAATRDRAASRMTTVPARVPTDPLRLADDARFRVPVTVLSGSLTDQSVGEVLSQWGAWADEFDAIEDTTIVTLGSGHWPQFSQPENLRAQIVAALRA